MERENGFHQMNEDDGFKTNIADNHTDKTYRETVGMPMKGNFEKENPDTKLTQSGNDSTKSSNSRIGLTSLKELWNSRISLSGGNFLFPMIFMICMICYLEVVLHLLIYRTLDVKIIYPILFAIPLGMVISFIAGLFDVKFNQLFYWLATVLACLIFITQLIYFYIFKVFFSFQSMGMAGDAVTNFFKEFLIAVKANIPGILLLLLPLLILAFLSGALDYGRRGVKEQSILLGAAAVFQIVAMVGLLLFGKGDYTPYDLYFHSKVPDMCGKQLGISTMTRFDLARLLHKKEDLVLADTISLNTDPIAAVTKSPTPVPVLTKAPDTKSIAQITKTAAQITETPTEPPTIAPVDNSPNIMDIDFAKLASGESNSTIRTLHQYFASVTPTNKNAYTGLFKGYNLIMITAEGFSPYAVNKEKTPTLYKLVREGFVFNNFYTALWQTSTSDGEYVAMTSLIPNGTRSMYNGRRNLWPFSLGHEFDLLGVESKAYHDHTYTYYQRNETHPNLGYVYKGNGNGLQLEHPDVWPESDVEMMESTVEDYINEDQFHVYYMTVSGHMNYSFSGNSMSYKNRELVADLPYSDDAKAYIACQIELDRALELLIGKLEAAGVADKTVIALSADHYPYGWEKYKLDELAGHVIDPNFEIYRNHFILWSEGIKEKVVIDKPCSSMDILPTLLNLFGFDYDSRLLMGQDILSNAPGLVILSNRSFITDQVMYNSETGEVVKLTKEKLPEHYIDNINKIVKNKFTVSKSTLQEDYYQYVFPDYPE